MPWGLEYNTNNFDYPVQESYQNNLASSFAPAFQTPAMDAYQNYLGQAPRQEDYQGGILQKILAGIAGFTTGMKNPLAGVQTSMGIMDAPYLRAMNQYQMMEPGLRQAASIEERGLGDRLNAMRYQQQGNLDRLKSDRDFQVEKMKLDNAFKIAAMNAQTDMDRARINQEHQRAMEGLEAQRIAATREGNQMDLLASFNPMNILKNFGAPRPQNQDEGYMRFQLENALKSDPLFQGAWGDTGFNLGNMEMTPEQYARYQQYIQQFSGQR